MRKLIIHKPRQTGRTHLNAMLHMLQDYLRIRYVWHTHLEMAPCQFGGQRLRPARRLAALAAEVWHAHT